MNQLEIWAIIAQSALNYIFISVINSNNQKQTVTDVKTDLRTTKEDLMVDRDDTLLVHSFGKDEVTDYHIIAERSYPDRHCYGVSEEKY